MFNVFPHFSTFHIHERSETPRPFKETLLVVSKTKR